MKKTTVFFLLAIMAMTILGLFNVVSAEETAEIPSYFSCTFSTNSSIYYCEVVNSRQVNIKFKEQEGEHVIPDFSDYSFYSYKEDDQRQLERIVAKFRKATDEEQIKYDLLKDGIIDSKDLVAGAKWLLLQERVESISTDGFFALVNNAKTNKRETLQLIFTEKGWNLVSEEETTTTEEETTTTAPETTTTEPETTTKEETTTTVEVTTTEPETTTAEPETTTPEETHIETFEFVCEGYKFSWDLPITGELDLAQNYYYSKLNFEKIGLASEEDKNNLLSIEYDQSPEYAETFICGSYDPMFEGAEVNYQIVDLYDLSTSDIKGVKQILSGERKSRYCYVQMYDYNQNALIDQGDLEIMEKFLKATPYNFIVEPTGFNLTYDNFATIMYEMKEIIPIGKFTIECNFKEVPTNFENVYTIFSGEKAMKFFNGRNMQKIVKVNENEKTVIIDYNSQELEFAYSELSGWWVEF